jgi:hypothetical protein
MKQSNAKRLPALRLRGYAANVWRSVLVIGVSGLGWKYLSDLPMLPVLQTAQFKFHQ